MPEKEATARIKINRLLEAAGWRFLPDGDQASNIRLEPSVMITSSDLAAVGDSKDRFLTFLDNALRDPVSGEIGKSIVFAVSRDHVAKLAQILIRIAGRMFFERFEDTVRENPAIAAAVEAGQWDRVIDCVNRVVFACSKR